MGGMGLNSLLCCRAHDRNLQCKDKSPDKYVIVRTNSANQIMCTTPCCMCYICTYDILMWLQEGCILLCTEMVMLCLPIYEAFML